MEKRKTYEEEKGMEAIFRKLIFQTIQDKKNLRTPKTTENLTQLLSSDTDKHVPVKSIAAVKKSTTGTQCKDTPSSKKASSDKKYY
jgi:hypothetical protein